MTYSKDAYSHADDIINSLNKNVGRDYSSGREEIARLFDEVLWHGNWDASTDFDGSLDDLRFIQEDEYDQHMDEDEDKPEDYLVYAGGHYVFEA